jgi:hypothetical protein
MLEILRQTPKWVFPVFFLLLYCGISALFPSDKSKRGISMLPAIFLAWSVINAVLSPYFVGASIASWTAGMAVGTAGGWLINRQRGSELTADGRRLRVPGSPFVLIVCMAYFAARYWIGYESAMHEELGATLDMAVIRNALNGACTGAFTGQAIAHLRMFNRLAAQNHEAGMSNA